MKQEITPELLATFEKEADYTSTHAAMRSVMAHGLSASAVDEGKKRTNPMVFNLELKAGDVCNQKQSGRCWMFAGLNILRMTAMEKLNVKNFEFSQCYLQFFDKLEKANFFLEKALERKDRPLDDPELVYLFDHAIEDGGHFAMFKNLVKKYGVVPSSVMPDSAVSSSTKELNAFLHRILAADFLALKEAQDPKKEKEAMLQDIYRLLTICLGVPPKSFVYEYTDKDEKAQRIQTTPKEFFDTYVGEELEDWVSLAHVPMLHFPPYEKVGAPLVNNVVEGEHAFFFNVSMDEFKHAVLSELKAGRPVWFGADVGAESLRKEGFLVKDILRLDELTGINPNIDKGQLLDTRVSHCSHAMAFTGANIEEGGRVSRYKVENSWGEENGKKGFYVMDEAWFETYVHQIFVRRSSLPEDLLKKYDEAKVSEVGPFNTLWLQD